MNAESNHPVSHTDNLRLVQRFMLDNGQPLTGDTNRIGHIVYNAHIQRQTGKRMPGTCALGLTISRYRPVWLGNEVAAEMTIIGEFAEAMPKDPVFGRQIGNAFYDEAGPVINEEDPVLTTPDYRIASVDLSLYESGGIKVDRVRTCGPEPLDPGLISNLSKLGLGSALEGEDNSKHNIVIYGTYLTPEQGHDAATFLMRILQNPEPK